MPTCTVATPKHMHPFYDHRWTKQTPKLFLCCLQVSPLHTPIMRNKTRKKHGWLVHVFREVEECTDARAGGSPLVPEVLNPIVRARKKQRYVSRCTEDA